jgi:hypothetical protein
MRLFIASILFAGSILAQTQPGQPPIPTDADQAIAGALNFEGAITQGVTQLITTVIPSLMTFGWTLLALFGVYALLQVLLQGSMRAISSYHPGTMAMVASYIAVLFRITACVVMMSFYSTPIPGVGFNFHQMFPAIANALAGAISTTLAQQVIAAFNNAMHYLPTAGIFDVLPAIVTVVVLLLFGFAEIGMVVITSGSWAIVGLLTLCGPLMIPFYVLPGWDKRFWSWFDNMLAYSMYVFSGTAFIFIFCHPYLQFFANLQSYTVGQWLPQIPYLLLITMSFLWTMFKVPEITHLIFGGAGGVAQGFANALQGITVRAIVAAVA